MIFQPKNKTTNNSVLVFGGNLKIIRFLDWIYKDASFVLDRKYKLYQELRKPYPTIIIGNPLHIRGEKHRLAKLKTLDVIEIKKELQRNPRTITDASLARKFKVIQKTIYEIKTKTTWKHIIV